MATSSEVKVEEPTGDDTRYRDVDEAFVDGQILGPELDPGSTTSNHFKEEAAHEDTKNAVQKLKSALVISGGVLAVIGAVFAVAKRIRETRL